MQRNRQQPQGTPPPAQQQRPLQEQQPPANPPMMFFPFGGPGGAGAAAPAGLAGLINTLLAGPTPRAGGTPEGDPFQAFSRFLQTMTGGQEPPGGGVHFTTFNAGDLGGVFQQFLPPEMRDDLSYEELIRLQEQIGDVPVGVPRDIVRQLPLVPYIAPVGPPEEGAAADEGDGQQACAICLDAYESGEQLRVLPCGGADGSKHRFHRDCVDKWLESSKLCPLCKQDVVELVEETASSLP